MMWASIASYLLCLIGMIIKMFYQDTVNYSEISTLIFFTFYLMNIGLLIGCLANTLRAESQKVARPLNSSIFEDARNLLAKYQMLKEWIINKMIFYIIYGHFF